MTNQEICNRLKQIEQENDVRILLAVESGSYALVSLIQAQTEMCV